MKKNSSGKYAVTTIFYESGDIEARETKPDDVEGSFENLDLYIHEFCTIKSAKMALDFIKVLTKHGFEKAKELELILLGEIEDTP